MRLKRFSNERYRGWIGEGLEIPAKLLEQPQRVGSLPGAELVLDCQARQIFRVRIPNGREFQSCFVYFFRNTSFGRSLRRCYSMHVLRVSELLRRKGLPTLEVMAAFRPKGQILNAESWMIAREIDSVLELPSVGRHIYQVHSWIQFDRNLAEAVAERLAGLHNHSFVHGDLKSRHILARKNGEESRPEVFFVDLEKTRRFPKILFPFHDIFSARDLIQLLASLPWQQDGRDLAGERALLLETYFRSRRLPPFRISFINRLLSWYGPEGRLKQGRTVLRSLWR